MIPDRILHTLESRSGTESKGRWERYSSTSYGAKRKLLLTDSERVAIGHRDPASFAISR